MNQTPRLCLLPKVRWCAALLLLLMRIAVAQDVAKLSPEHPSIEIKGTPELETMLRIHNRDIVRLRATVGGFVPVMRAKDIGMRVNEILKKSATPPSVTIKPISQGVAFYLGENVAFALVYEDLDTTSGETIQQVSEEAERRLKVAIKESFEARSMAGLVESIVFASGATAGFLVFLLIMHKMRVAFQGFVDHRRRFAMEAGERLTALTRITRSAYRTFILLSVVGLELGVANLWLTFVLQRFPYTRPWGETFSRKALLLLLQVGSAIARALPGLTMVAIIMAACYVSTRAINKVFSSIKSGEITLQLIHPEVAAPTRRLVAAGIWIFGLVLAYPNLPGSQTDAFKGISVLLGLLVTLGSSGVFGQALCGILLMYSRAFKAGDYVSIDATEGVVIEVGALSTKIRTIKNEVVNIPNSVVVTTQTKNYSKLQKTTGVIVHTEVTIGYTAPWRQVEAMLLLAAEHTEGIRQSPAPFVLQTALGDYAVQYQLNAYLDRAEEKVPMLALLHRRIQDVFNEYGVQIMTPHYRRDPVEPQVVPRVHWFDPPANDQESAVPNTTMNAVAGS